MISDEQLVEQIQRRHKDLRITLSDLRNPTGKFLQQYFMSFFEDFGVDVSVFVHHPPEQLQALEYPVAFKSVLPIRNYYCAVQYIFQHIFSNFKINITDLTEPTPAKTKVLIMCTEEFYNYADSKAVEVISLEEAMMQKKDYYMQQLHDVELLKETINKRAVEVAQMQLHIKQRSEQIAEQDVKITELQMQAMKLDEENMDMEAEMAKSNFLLDEVEKEKVQLGETLKELEFKVSQLPTEAMLAAITEKKIKLLEEVACTMKRVEEKNIRCATTEKKLKRLEDINSKLSGIIALSQKLDSRKAEFEALERQQKSQTEKLEADDERYRKMHARIAQQAEERAAQQAQWLEKKAFLEKQIEEERRKNETLRKEKEEEQKELKHIENLILKMDEELCKIKNENKEICRMYDETFKKMTKEQEEVLFRLSGKQYNLLKNE